MRTKGSSSRHSHKDFLIDPDLRRHKYLVVPETTHSVRISVPENIRPTESEFRKFLSHCHADVLFWTHGFCNPWRGVIKKDTRENTATAVFLVNKNYRAVQKLSYIWFCGDLDLRQRIRTTCSTEHCINPNHLEPVVMKRTLRQEERQKRRDKKNIERVLCVEKAEKWADWFHMQESRIANHYDRYPPSHLDVGVIHEKHDVEALLQPLRPNHNQPHTHSIITRTEQSVPRTCVGENSEVLSTYNRSTTSFTIPNRPVGTPPLIPLSSSLSPPERHSHSVCTEESEDAACSLSCYSPSSP